MAKETITLGINLRKNNNSHSRAYGKYYPEVDRTDTLSLRGFAEHLTSHGSLFGRDVIEAVLTKVVQCLPELCSQGVAVKLGDLGIFYPTAQVAKNGALTDETLAGANPNDVVQAIHIRFLQSMHGSGDFNNWNQSEIFGNVPIIICIDLAPYGMCQ